MASAPELLGEGFDAGSLFDPTRKTSVSSNVASNHDEAELVAAARAELKNLKAGKPSRWAASADCTRFTSRAPLWLAVAATEM